MKLTGRKKKSKRRLVIEIIVLVIIAYNIILRAIPVSFGVISNDDDANDAVVRGALRYSNSFSIKTESDPYLDYQWILDGIMEKNMYAGGEFYAFSYTTKDKGDYCNVKINIRRMSRVKSMLVNLRTTLIANKIKGLSDYEKVKAVHDYIILHNEYDIAAGGSFNALYIGGSSCNGYALSFYMIMKKAGVPVTCEYGYGNGGEHLWNRVKVDGYWYNIDLTWDDHGGNRVSYDYFLKSDADFGDHETEITRENQDGPDATESHPVTGKSAEEYADMFPNYNLIMIVIIVVIIAGSFALYLWLLDRKMKREKIEKQKIEEYEEQLRRENMQERLKNMSIGEDVFSSGEEANPYGDISGDYENLSKVSGADEDNAHNKTVDDGRKNTMGDASSGDAQGDTLSREADLGNKNEPPSTGSKFRLKD